MSEIFVDTLEAFGDRTRRLLSDGDLEIGIFRMGDRFYAFANSCPHQGGPVCQGKIMPQVEERLGSERQSLGLVFSDDQFHLVCPWHGYEYGFETGAHPGSPLVRLRRFETRVADGKVYVLL